MEELIIADEFNIDDSIEDDSSSNATNNNNNDDGCQYQFEFDVECQFKYTEWTISIVFHQTWRVPTLYFTCAQTYGTPLCRQQVLDVSLLQHENQNHNIKCRDIMEVYIPRGTSNDWATLLFLHSCQTSERVDLMMEMFMIWYQNHSHSALVTNHKGFSRLARKRSSTFVYNCTRHKNWHR